MIRRRGMLRKTLLSLLCALILLALTAGLYARESYEDYMQQKYSGSDRDVRIKRDRPLSEVDPSEREELLDELRGAVREEIDQSIKEEKGGDKKRVNESKFIEEVRSIVREEIEDAIKIKQGRYLNSGTVEIGGFLSYQARGVDSDEEDNNNIIRVFPQFAYFLSNNVAFALKGEAEFNLTTDTQAYAGGAGPQFVFGITRRNDVCFYADMMAGISRNTRINDKFGYRYSNGIGLKFVMTSGVIFNAGVQLVFDNLGENETGFQNIIVPTIGITAWF